MQIAGLAELSTATQGGDPEIRIAILDGPVNRHHRSLVEASLEYAETVTEDLEGHLAEHGTHVTSLLFGQGDPRGLAPACSGLVLPIYPVDGGQLRACSQADLAAALDRAREHRVDVINISGGELRPSVDDSHPLLKAAVERCVDAGILVVAAAGNDGCDCQLTPAALPGVLAVGAEGDDGQPLAFSNWGDAYREQGLLAPGANLSGAAPQGGEIERSGTSFATAVVSGVAALLMSYEHQHGRRLDGTAVRTLLLDTARPCPVEGDACRRFLAGSIDAAAAFERLASSRFSKAAAASSAVGRSDQPTNHPLPMENLMNPTEETRSSSALPEGAESRQDESLPTVGPAIDVAGPTMPTVAPPSAPAAIAPAAAEEVVPAGCGDHGLAYVVGQLDIEFVSDARRDSIQQSMGGAPPTDTHALLDHLDKTPWEADSVLWLLSIEGTPMYALRPGGPYAATLFDRLRDALRQQIDHDVERVAIAGALGAPMQLQDGRSWPVLAPDPRGIFAWSTDALIAAVAGKPPKDKEAAAEHEKAVAGVHNFLERVYYEFRNLGVTSHDRALNFSATNAFQAFHVLQDAAQAGLELDTIEAEQSPIGRPGSDTWDVKMVFFDPRHRMETARRVFRFTIDVSDVIPVTIGPVRSWSIY
ncbi:MAG: PatA/PatG family cyanobactin maturation protease [Acidobacteriota bacterium]